MPPTAAYPSQQSPVQPTMMAAIQSQQPYYQQPGYGMSQATQQVAEAGPVYDYVGYPSSSSQYVYQPASAPNPAHHQVIGGADAGPPMQTAVYYVQDQGQSIYAVNAQAGQQGPAGAMTLPVWNAPTGGTAPVIGGQPYVPAPVVSTAAQVSQLLPDYAGQQQMYNMYTLQQQQLQQLAQLQQQQVMSQHQQQQLTAAGMQPQQQYAMMAQQPVNPLIHSTNMEVVWQSSFLELFGTFIGHYWQLAPTDVEPRVLESIPGTKLYKDSAKVRFLCSGCGKAWTSMKGRVIFWIRLSLQRGEGSVQFKLFGQRCMGCNCATYQTALWYPEEVKKVVTNVYNRVGQLYYGFQRPAHDESRRTGRPRSQHNSAYCQACDQGICNERRDDGAVALIAGLSRLALTPNQTQQQHQQVHAVPVTIAIEYGAAGSSSSSSPNSSLASSSTTSVER